MKKIILAILIAMPTFVVAQNSNIPIGLSYNLNNNPLYYEYKRNNIINGYNHTTYFYNYTNMYYSNNNWWFNNKRNINYNKYKENSIPRVMQPNTNDSLPLINTLPKDIQKREIQIIINPINIMKYNNIKHIKK